MKKKVFSICIASLVVVGGFGVAGSVFGSSSSANIVSAAQTDQEPIEEARAVQIAKDKFGGEVINVEIDTEHGQKMYEVEMKNTAKGRIDVDVSAETGKIIEIDVERDDDEGHDEGHDEGKHKQMHKDGVYPKISIDHAEQIALSQLDGRDGRVEEVKLDQDDGEMVYKVEIETQNGLEYDLKIDANSGKVVEMELDD